MSKKLLPLLLIFLVPFTNIRKGFSQTITRVVEHQSGTMSPEQAKSMLKMAINALPPDKRGEIEEIINTIETKAPPVVKTVGLKDKTVSFVPMMHVGMPEFYHGVKDIVEEYKAKGYTVYYEMIKVDTLTKAKSDVAISLKKVRKMLGIYATPKIYYTMMKPFFPGVVSQPEYKDLGITDTDINADIYMDQLIDGYEKKYGKIELTECDLNTSTDTFPYPCGKLNNDLNPFILDMRNQYVADLIKSSGDKKILVLYGALHIKGMMEMIGQ